MEQTFFCQSIFWFCLILQAIFESLNQHYSKILLWGRERIVNSACTVTDALQLVKRTFVLKKYCWKSKLCLWRDWRYLSLYIHMPLIPSPTISTISCHKSYYSSGSKYAVVWQQWYFWRCKPWTILPCTNLHLEDEAFLSING